ncbi:ABC transporter permease [soil metagenome]
MKRIAGVTILLVTLYSILFAINPQSTEWGTQRNLLNQQAFFGILTLGVGLLIITGGIDLSMGSVVGFSAVLFGILLKNGVAPYSAMVLVLMSGCVIGAIHAGLITRLKLQPFLVTLCGLFVYRGAARMLSPGQPVGLQEILNAAELQGQKQGDMTAYTSLAGQLETLRQTLVGKDLQGVLAFPMEVVVLLVLAVILGVVLHRSIWGRYWYAVGHNEQAAKYAGISTEKNKFAVYVLCSFLASLCGILTLLDYYSASPPTTGETWELYAITGAVLGGCSLRGGEGSVPGMVLGAAVLPLLRKVITAASDHPWVLSQNWKIDEIIPALIGLTLLLGTIADEYFRRRAKHH